MFLGCAAEIFRKVRADGVEWLLEAQSHQHHALHPLKLFIFVCVLQRHRMTNMSAVCATLRICEQNGPVAGCFLSGYVSMLTDFFTERRLWQRDIVW